MPFSSVEIILPDRPVLGVYEPVVESTFCIAGRFLTRILADAPWLLIEACEEG
jgi:hypothetical protein